MNNLSNHALSLQAIEVAFPLSGDSVPFEHGYALFSALSEVLPELHGAKWLGVHPIHGFRREDGRIRIDAGSQIRLRLPPERIRDVLPLARKTLKILDHPIQLGDARIHTLRPSPRLRCYRATIRGAMDEASFFQSMTAQMQALGIQASVSFRKVKALEIKGKKITCFRVFAEHLSREHSLLLQVAGIGGRRRMGCGLFDPV